MQQKSLATKNNNGGVKRRDVLKTGLMLGGAALLPSLTNAFPTIRNNVNKPETKVTGRRKLSKLEVSSVGIGVQNMSRTYYTTIPSRYEMFNIIRAAFDNGVTFYDAAEAYGPHEVERILGEGVASFSPRDAVVALCNGGGYAEYVAVPAGQVLPLPRGMTMIDWVEANQRFEAPIIIKVVG